MIENELSFLVASMPDLAGCRKKEISQHYLVDGSNLRLRAADGKYELTKKLRLDEADGTRKEEINVPLTEPEYRALVRNAHRGLEKTRWMVPLLGAGGRPEGLTAELDVYHGPLEGFMKVEVEFPDEAARAAFVPPAWFGRDVSLEEWSGNSWLAGKTYEDVRRFL